MEPTVSEEPARASRVLSIVVPCFNEESVLDETHRRLTSVCAQNAIDDYEIIYVDDGSDDGTWKSLTELAENDEKVVAVALSRNFGHQAALSAGLSLARGERVLMIDADLQDPPELLGSMMQALDAGADAAYGVRIAREGETVFKTGSAKIFYWLINLLADVKIPENAGDFRLINRSVLDALLKMPENHRFVRGMIAWLGFRQEPIFFARNPRFSGKTKYSFRKMLTLAFDAVTGFSVKPLRISLMLSLTSFLIAILVLFYALISWFLGDTVKGWTSLVIIFALFSGLQLFTIGIIGEYIGRMFMEIKNRPLFVLREVYFKKKDC